MQKVSAGNFGYRTYKVPGLDEHVALNFTPLFRTGKEALKLYVAELKLLLACLWLYGFPFFYIFLEN